MSTYPVTTDKQALRKKKACARGYNKLLCALAGKKYDPHREHRVRYVYHDPIPLTYIVESNGFGDALWALRASNISKDDCMMYTLALARCVQGIAGLQQVDTALDVAEAQARGEGSRKELRAALFSVLDATETIVEDAVRFNAARAVHFALAAASHRGARLLTAVLWATYTAHYAVRAVAGSGLNLSPEDTPEGLFLAMCSGTAPWQTKGA